MRTKHVNDQNHGKHGYVGGNPRYGKARGNWRGQRAATRFNGRNLLNQHLQDLAAEAKAKADRLAAEAKRQAVLLVSGGCWRLEVYTQVLENYGDSDNPRWKCKGGNEYQVRFDHEPTTAEYEAALDLLRRTVSHNGPGYQEYLNGCDLFAPDQESPGEHQIREMQRWGCVSPTEADRLRSDLTAWQVHLK